MKSPERAFASFGCDKISDDTFDKAFTSELSFAVEYCGAPHADSANIAVTKAKF
ncbi:hypothetical protein PQZ41_03095 [Planktomarina temperata]|nr:hypothetical protein [Planktomarina temperata]